MWRGSGKGVIEICETVIPAKAAIHAIPQTPLDGMGPRLRGGDDG